MSTRNPLKAQAQRRDGGRCCNCGEPADHVHHVVPLARGGRDVLGNLVSLCGRCHGAVHGLDLVHHQELTRAGLASAKARGVKLGGLRPNTIRENEAAKVKAQAAAERLRPLLTTLQAQGLTLQQMAHALAGAGTRTRNGNPLSPTQVSRLLQRLELSPAAA